jgi:hypothetical protein
MDFPFKQENINDNTLIRTFSSNVDSENLVWHRDREDRIICAINETDWKFQLDNELPINLDREIFVPKGVYHRLIKGNDDLVLRINQLF